MQDDERQETDALTKALLLRAAQVREQRNELQRRGPQAAPARHKVPVRVRNAEGQPDRVVMIIGGRHYVAPVAGRHPLKVAEALYRYISKVEDPTS